MTANPATESAFSDKTQAVLYERMCYQAAYLWSDDAGGNVEYEFGQTDLIRAVVGWAEFPLDHEDINAYIVQLTRVLNAY